MFDGVPNEWRLSTVGDVVEILDSRRIPLNSEERRTRKGPYPYWGANGIVDFIDAYIFDEPLVLMAEDGGYFADASSKPICHRLDGPAWVNNHAHVLRPVNVDRDFFYYYFVHRDITEFIKGGTRTKLNQSDLRRLPITLPPLDEQRRIAEVLRSVDKALIAEQQTLSQIVALKNSAIEHFIGEATRVEPISLAEIISSIDAGWSPNCENAPALRGEWAILKTSAVTWTGYHDEQNKRLPKTLEPRPLLSVDLGDILITRAGPAERTGVVAMVDETVGRRMLSDKLIRIRVNPKRASARTVATILGSRIVQAQIDRVKSGMAASQTNISQKIVSDLEIPLPPLERQLKFATFMDTMIRKVKGSVAQLEHLTDLKNNLAGDLLSGRVRVPA